MPYKEFRLKLPKNLCTWLYICNKTTKNEPNFGTLNEYWRNNENIVQNESDWGSPQTREEARFCECDEEQFEKKKKNHNK